MKHVLIVDDDPEVAELYRDYLEDAGYRVDAVGRITDAEHYLNEQARPTVVLIDYHMLDGLGTDLARDIHYRYPSLPLILITVEAAAAASVERDFFFAVLIKPIDPSVLLTLLDSL